METAERLKFSLVPEKLQAGSPEERAAFGTIAVIANGMVLTEGVGIDGNKLRKGPRVSGYYLAEWLVWNWWRLRWEPRRFYAETESSWEWSFAHHMSSLGEGYVWPNIEIVSDGLLMQLASSPSTDPHAKAFRYVGAPGIETVAVEAFEDAVQEFVRIVIDRLDDSGICDTNLHRLWRDLKREQGAETSPFRRIEAMLGYDPDEGNETEIREQLTDAAGLGENAVAELAADAGQLNENPVRAAEVRECARKFGFDVRVEDAAQLDDTSATLAWGEEKAWRVGYAMAQALRAAEVLNGKPVVNAVLCELAGTTENVIQDRSRTADRISFALDDDGGRSRISLRPEQDKLRRFDLARLMADRLFLNTRCEPLLPATRSYTYRQKAQRAFAAEFLAPIRAVEEFLNGDVSEETQNDAAEYFNVSPLAIHWQLVNNNRISRSD